MRSISPLYMDEEFEIEENDKPERPDEKTQKEIKRVVIAMIALGIIIPITFGVAWFLEMDLFSIVPWTGAFIIFLTIFFYYTTPLIGKIITVMAAIVAIAFYLVYFFNFSIQFSLLIGMIVVAILGFGYLAG